MKTFLVIILIILCLGIYSEVSYYRALHKKNQIEYTEMEKDMIKLGYKNEATINNTHYWSR
jgi:predicted Holliday junction resolvase-like endonuclease